MRVFSHRKSSGSKGDNDKERLSQQRKTVRNVASICLASCSLFISACSEMRESWEWTSDVLGGSRQANAPPQHPQQGREIPPTSETKEHLEVLRPTPDKSPPDSEKIRRPQKLLLPTTPREKPSYIDIIAPIPYKEGAFESFVAKVKRETNYSWLRLLLTSSVPDYLPKDKGTKKLGRFERDDHGRPLANYFAPNFYRQAGLSRVGPFTLSIVPISISDAGEALENAKFDLHRTESGEGRIFSLPGSSWSYELGNFYLYRWRALPNKHGLYGIELLAPKVDHDDQSKRVEFFYDAYVYFTKGRNGDIYYKKITVTLPSQYIPEIRIF